MKIGFFYLQRRFKMFGILLFILVLAAWFFLVWGVIKTSLSNLKEHAEDRIFMVKTFWILFSGSILWLIVGSTRFFMGLPAWGYFIFFLGLAWETYVFYKKIKTMPRK